MAQPVYRQPTYRQVKRSSLTRRFEMNEVKYLRFSDKDRYHLTDELNGCFALFLISSLATISAHIPPHPGNGSRDPQAGSKNLVVRMEAFRDLYVTNRESFDGKQACLVYAQFEGKTALEDHKVFIEKCLRAMNIDFALQDYYVKYPGEPRSEEHGTAFVDGMAPGAVVLYVEDRVAIRVSKSKPTSTTASESRDTRSSDTTRMASYALPRTEAGMDYEDQFLATRPNPSALFPRQTQTIQSRQANELRAQYSSTPRRNEAASKTADTKTPQQDSSRNVEYVKSATIDGVRKVIVKGQAITMQKGDWQIKEAKGRQILFCAKHNLWTDI